MASLRECRGFAVHTVVIADVREDNHAYAQDHTSMPKRSRAVSQREHRAGEARWPATTTERRRVWRPSHPQDAPHADTQTKTQGRSLGSPQSTGSSDLRRIREPDSADRHTQSWRDSTLAQERLAAGCLASGSPAGLRTRHAAANLRTPIGVVNRAPRRRESRDRPAGAHVGQAVWRRRLSRRQGHVAAADRGLRYVQRAGLALAWLASGTRPCRPPFAGNQDKACAVL